MQKETVVLIMGIMTNVLSFFQMSISFEHSKIFKIIRSLSSLLKIVILKKKRVCSRQTSSNVSKLHIGLEILFNIKKCEVLV